MTNARATGTWLVAEEETVEEEEALAPAPPEPVEREVVPGFYAGSSKGDPPPLRTGRKVAVGAGVAAVLLAVGGVVVLSGGDDSGDPSAAAPIADREPAEGEAAEQGAGTDTQPDTPTGDGDGTTAGEGDAAGSTPEAPPADGEAGPADAVAAVDAVEVGDAGWYVAEDGTGSYGFAVENTTDQVIGSFMVQVTGFDEAGGEISGIEGWEHVVGTLQPYQRLLVAGTVHHEGQAAEGIGRLDFEVSEVLPGQGFATSGDVPEGSVAVGQVEKVENIARTRVSYRVASTYDIPLDANAYVVFLDAAGEIVGGSHSFIDLPAGGSVGGDFDLVTDSISPDATRVEVHVAPHLPL
jgi:hypothetical protein